MIVFEDFPSRNKPINSSNLNGNFNEIDEKINNLVPIESGSNSDGTWIKYNDGTLICTKKVTKNRTITNAYGSIYYEGLYTFGNWAYEFSCIDSITVSSFTSNLIWSTVCNEGGNISLPSRINIFSPIKIETAISIDFCFLAIGRWEQE